MHKTTGILTVCAALPLMLTGCHTWELETLAPGQTASWNQPVRVVLTTAEGIEFEAARVSRDTLFGTPRRGSSDSTIAIPIRRMLRVERREFSDERTTAVVVGSLLATVAVLLTAFLVALSGMMGG